MQRTSDKRRLWVAVLTALSLHILVISLASRHVPKPKPNNDRSIPVQLVVFDSPETPVPHAVSPLPDITEPAPQSSPITELKPTLRHRLKNQTDPIAEPVLYKDGSGMGDGTRRTKADDHVLKAPPSRVTFNDRWQLTEPASTSTISPVVAGLAATLDCSRGFKIDCAAQRKQIFAEQQLSETDKVWMPTYAHSGLSDARFRGMSEAQIRSELSIPTAGENGWSIPIINLAIIDSSWTDQFYGVNKTCKIKWGLAPDGEATINRDCEPLAKSQKDMPMLRRNTWQPGGAEPETIPNWLLKAPPE